MGTKGTLVVQTESEVMLYPPAAARPVHVGDRDHAGQRPTGARQLGQPPRAWSRRQCRARVRAAATVYSRGYREEMEHMAYCIRMRDQGMDRDREDLKPRCHGRAAMADAIIALGANQAFQSQQPRGLRGRLVRGRPRRARLGPHHRASVGSRNA